MSFLGVGYVFGDGNLKLFQSVSSGNIDPYFSSYELNGTNDMQEGLQIRREDDVITITGKVQPGYQGTLYYEVANRGTVPVKCSTVEILTVAEVIAAAIDLVVVVVTVPAVEILAIVMVAAAEIAKHLIKIAVLANY